MQQYFGDDFDINNEPSRNMIYNNTIENDNIIDESNPLLPVDNVFLNEIKPKVSNELPITPPMLKDNDINSYNNDINRFNNLSQEILEKEKEIMEYKGQINDLKHHISNIQEENKKISVLEYENNQLKEKLNNSMMENQSLVDKRNVNNILVKRIKKDEETITQLKKMISEINSNSNNNNNNIKRVKQPRNKGSKKNKKQLKNLKKSLQKHFPNYSNRDIDKLFDEMDINENVNITKDLLNAITGYMSIN